MVTLVSWLLENAMRIIIVKMLSMVNAAMLNIQKQMQRKRKAIVNLVMDLMNL